MRNFAPSLPSVRRMLLRTAGPRFPAKRSFCPLCILLCLLTPGLWACRAGRDASPDALPSAHVAAGSRVLIPADGGQTIRMPRLMGDAHALWSPLNARERAVALDLPALNAEERLAVWLPHTEENVMRRYLGRLTEARRGTTDHVLRRAALYMPVVLEGVRRQGLPQELACLPLVESAFEPGCVSSAGAAGLWQLMPQTAREFGLRVDRVTDERFDVEKSTAAATLYLAYLYDLFHDWPLALAAYNSGEGTMRRALRRYGNTSLAEVMRQCRADDADKRVLQEETLRYVPQFAAAVLIMSKNHELGLGGAPLLPETRAARSPSRSSGRAAPEQRRLAMQGSYDALPPASAAPPPMSRLP